jgi:glyoxylase-like metal-dependent hydrolase (beta-lactamase superfamily II)
MNGTIADKPTKPWGCSMLHVVSVFCVILCLVVLYGVPARAAGPDAVIKVGQAEVCLLTEGADQRDKTLLLGADDAQIKQYLPNGTYPTAANAFLIRTPQARILVDTGYGRKLFGNLSRLHVSPDQIDAVLLTHMHGDHIGGLLRDGKQAFPKAKVYVAVKERAYWTDQAIMASKPEAAQGNFKQAQASLQAYGDRVVAFEPGEADAATADLLPGIRAIAAYGHTPGHTMFLLGTGQDQLLLWGDLTHAMAIQMPVPQVAMTFDVDAKAAVETRLKVLRYVAERKLPVAGAHIPIPGMGNLKAQGAGYVFTPIP